MDDAVIIKPVLVRENAGGWLIYLIGVVDSDIHALSQSFVARKIQAVRHPVLRFDYVSLQTGARRR